MRRTLTVLVQLLAGLVFVGSPAYAQVFLNVIGNPQDETILVTGSLLAPSSLAETTLTFRFPGPISTPVGGIHIEGATGVFTAVTVTSDVPAGVIQVILPSSANNNQSGSFRLLGFHFPACGPILLSLNALANNYILNTTTINQPPPFTITSATTPGNGTVQIRGTGPFCSPRVFFGQAELSGVMPLSTGDGVGAILPANIAPGTYLLNVSRFAGDSNTFSLTIGAVGPPGPKGDTGAPGSQGPPGTPGVSGLQTVVGSPVTIARKTTGTATAACPSGLKVIGGGFATTVPSGSKANPSDLDVFTSSPNGMSAWIVSAANNSDSKAEDDDNKTNSNNRNNNALVIKAYALCAIAQ